MRTHHGFRLDFAFDLFWTRDAFSPDNPVLLQAIAPPGDQPARCLVYVDDGIVRRLPGYPERIAAWFSTHEPDGLQLAAPPRALPGGEVAKADFRVVERVGADAAEHGICRHSFILAVGGGAVLDAVGLGAALVHRGVHLVRLPSTVLAQDDAGLGVKNAINAFGHKNFYGTFTTPRAVVNDLDLLRELDDRHHRAGFAEAFKVALIEDRDFLHWLINHAAALGRRETGPCETAVRRCAELHLAHITGAGDPFERGSSRPLDMGHWSGHRLEVLSDHALNHGEAVAVGLALDLLYARRQGFVDAHLAGLVIDALDACGFRLWHEALDLRDRRGRRRVLEGLEQFREHLGGELCLAMPDGAGRRQDIHHLDEDLFEDCARELKRLVAGRCRLAAGPGTGRDPQRAGS